MLSANVYLFHDHEYWFYEYLLPFFKITLVSSQSRLSEYANADAPVSKDADFSELVRACVLSCVYQRLMCTGRRGMLSAVLNGIGSRALMSLNVRLHCTRVTLVKRLLSLDNCPSLFLP